METSFLSSFSLLPSSFPFLSSSSLPLPCPSTTNIFPLLLLLLLPLSLSPTLSLQSIILWKLMAKWK